MDSKQCLLAALHCSWSSEPLFIHRHIGIQSASSLFSLITNKLQFLCMWRLKANYLWETGPEESERPLAKWFTLRAILFYRLLNSLDHSKICMYYSAFQRKKCYPARQSSAFLDTVMHLRHAAFQDQVKVLFFSRGQIKWVEKGVLSSDPPSRFSPPLAAVKALKWEASEEKLQEHVLMSVNWKKCRASWGSAAKGRNFHLCERLFKNICCRPDAEMGCVRHVVPNTSRCKVKGLPPFQEQLICSIIVSLHTCDDSSNLNKIVCYRLFIFWRNNLKSLMALTGTAVCRSITNTAHGCVSLVHGTLVAP